MLDIKFIRENAEKVKESCKNRNMKCDIDRLLELDEKRRNQMQTLEELKAEKNKINDEIKELKLDKIKGATIITKGIVVQKAKKIKEKLEKIKPELEEINIEYEKILYQIPNVYSEETPVGPDESGNKVIKKVGEPKVFDFEVKDHMQLGVSLDLIDVEKAAEVSGSRFYYLKNEAVFLQFAIANFVFNTLANENILKSIIEKTGAKVSSKLFVPIIPPVMIKDDVQKKIHRVFGEQTYCFGEDKINLVASAEHTLAPYHMNQVIDKKDLPFRYIGYSVAFRREAGTYGKDMGGILRTHQFDKLEMESFTDSESGEEEQKFIVGVQEYLVGQLGLSYQVMQICTGDMGRPDYKQIDIECWMPGQNKYRETHTSDYMTDYQMRGIKSFYKDNDGNKKLLHTNDATAFAIGRILIAILENYQQADGSVKIPEVLKKYMPEGMAVIKKK
ncbi:MAG TPA: serine--tRNA ligase [Candidatus Moranbacteria bacterium]|nr:serine--tRNA ligase [Candidatus Moranbacteria bacterium]HAT74581.1 serine--tRNA ligase [Candidatus Moranbacteria bacterium]